MVATLATLADRVQSMSFPAPVLFIVGRVVEVHEELRACRGSLTESASDEIGRAQNA